jgi:hypothetical protein
VSIQGPLHWEFADNLHKTDRRAIFSSRDNRLSELTFLLSSSKLPYPFCKRSSHRIRSSKLKNPSPIKCNFNKPKINDLKSDGRVNTTLYATL